jgi:hypothetical protein
MPDSPAGVELDIPCIPMTDLLLDELQSLPGSITEPTWKDSFHTLEIRFKALPVDCYCSQRYGRLLHAAESRIGTASRGFQPGQPATLRHRATGKQSIQEFHAAMRMKAFFKCVMNFTCVNGRFAIMTNIELLQCTHGIPVLRSRSNTLASGDIRGRLLRPAWRRMRETIRVVCL